jgi:multiple RNA-binding domain-containing protein 1
LAAYEALDKRSFQGRLLHILAEVLEGDGKKKSVKDEKSAKRKVWLARNLTGVW